MARKSYYVWKAGNKINRIEEKKTGKMRESGTRTKEDIP